MAAYGRPSLRDLFDESPTPHIAHPPRTHHRDFYIATDGSYTDTSGGLGAVIETRDGERVARLSLPDNAPDNNVAEYRALHLGLDDSRVSRARQRQRRAPHRPRRPGGERQRRQDRGRRPGVGVPSRRLRPRRDGIPLARHPRPDQRLRRRSGPHASPATSIRPTRWPTRPTSTPTSTTNPPGASCRSRRAWTNRSRRRPGPTGAGRATESTGTENPRGAAGQTPF